MVADVQSLNTGEVKTPSGGPTELVQLLMSLCLTSTAEPSERMRRGQAILEEAGEMFLLCYHGKVSQSVGNFQIDHNGSNKGMV